MPPQGRMLVMIACKSPEKVLIEWRRLAIVVKKNVSFDPADIGFFGSPSHWGTLQKFRVHNQAELPLFIGIAEFRNDYAPYKK